MLSMTATSETGDTSGWRTWRAGWERHKRGDDCVLCLMRGIEQDDWGIRVMDGDHADGYLWRTGSIPGYCLAIWKHDHVAEPTQLTDEAAAGYWLDVLRLGRALEDFYEPAKMNYQTLGNTVPHLHTHVIPRPARDPAPNAPMPWRYLDEGRRDDDAFRDRAQQLRAHLSPP